MEQARQQGVYSVHRWIIGLHTNVGQPSSNHARGPSSRFRRYRRVQ
jgi:hypothetical protein